MMHCTSPYRDPPSPPPDMDLTVEGLTHPDMGSLTMITEFVSASCRQSFYYLKVKFKCKVLTFGISNISWLLPFPVKNGLKCKMNNFISFFQFFPSNKMFRFSSIGYFWQTLFCVRVCVCGGGRPFITLIFYSIMLNSSNARNIVLINP